MIYFVWPVLLILLYSFQTTWFEISRGLIVAPDLLLLFVIYFAMKKKLEQSILVGVLVGVFRDVLILSFFGYYTLTYFLVTVILGSLRDTMYKSTFIPYLVLVIIVTLFTKGIYFLLMLFSIQGQISLLGATFSQFPIAIILNLLFAIPCYWLYTIIDKIIDKYREPKGDNYEKISLKKSKMKKSDYQ
jgi:rod shape-determining protein MreD